MMEPFQPLELLLEVAIDAAHAAGRHALRERNRRHDVIELTQHDIKLQLDVESQQAAEAVIRRRFPDAAILGEEGGAGAVGERPMWVIDPIDGTINFFHGIPLWCSCVAVQAGPRTLVGAIFLPELDRLYTATADGPALCNGSPIHVSKEGELARSLVFTGFNKDFQRDPKTVERFRTILGRVQKIRLLGAAAIDLCFVADGSAEGYYETGGYLWDVAAGGLIVDRAGGRAEVLEEIEPLRYRFLATNGLLHEPLKELLASTP